MKINRTDVSARAIAEVWLWRHGWVWPLALLIAIAPAALSLAVWLPQRSLLVDLTSALTQARTESQRHATPDPGSAATSADARTAIVTSPAADQLVAQMIQIAKAEGVSLPQGEYQQHVVADPSIVQLQITQPVHATYPQIRHYVEAVLRSMPNASLDQLAARRENVGQPQLEARLRWSLWLPRSQVAQTPFAQERATP